MVNQVENWYTNIPIITRCILTISAIMSCLVTLDVLSPLHLYLNYRQMWAPKYQVWRLVTHFFFFDRLSINFVLHMYFVYFYCTRLEEHTFHRKSADFLIMLVFGMVSMMCLSPLFTFLMNTLSSVYHQLFMMMMMMMTTTNGGTDGTDGSGVTGGTGGSNSHHMHHYQPSSTNPFMSHSLVIMMLYVWSRCNPHERLRLYGLFTIGAGYLSYVLLVLGMLMGMNPLNDLIGILVGHMYYFVNHVLVSEYPHMRPMIQSPLFLRRLLNQQQQEQLEPELEEEYQEEQQQPEREREERQEEYDVVEEENYDLDHNPQEENVDHEHAEESNNRTLRRRMQEDYENDDHVE